MNKLTHLESLLGRAGLSKSEFAELYGCHLVSVSRWNKNMPKCVESWLDMYIELEEKGRKDEAK